MSDAEIEDLYNRQVDRVYKICFMFFKGNKTDIEDAIQSIFMKVIEKKIVFQNLEHETAWFVITTNNYCKNKVSHWWNKTRELDFDVAEEVKSDETLNKIFELPDKYKTAIYMHYYEGYTCLEIANILNKSENTIYSYLHRGRNILKEMIQEEYNEGF